MDTNNSGRLLIAVANPKQFLFAPFELAIVNIVLSVLIMVVAIVIFGLTPFWAMPPLIVGHGLLVVLGTRNPHLTTTLQATGKYPMMKPNRLRVRKGVKYIP